MIKFFAENPNFQKLCRIRKRVSTYAGDAEAACLPPASAKKLGQLVWMVCLEKCCPSIFIPDRAIHASTIAPNFFFMSATREIVHVNFCFKRDQDEAMLVDCSPIQFGMGWGKCTLYKTMTLQNSRFSAEASFLLRPVHAIPLNDQGPSQTWILNHLFIK